MKAFTVRSKDLFNRKKNPKLSFSARDIAKNKKIPKKEVSSNRGIAICQHRVSYYYRIDQEMPDHEIEHVKKMICEGYSQGELNCLMPDGNTENRGWWHIER